MNIKILITTEKELEKIENPLNKQFGKHIANLLLKEKYRHLKHGLNYFVENVTKQSRIIFFIENETIHILHCFKTHKEYEKWFKSYK